MKYKYNRERSFLLLSADFHKDLDAEAVLNDISLNQFINVTLLRHTSPHAQTELTTKRYRGEARLRLTSEQHKTLLHEARQRHISVNTLILNTLFRLPSSKELNTLPPMSSKKTYSGRVSVYFVPGLKQKLLEEAAQKKLSLSALISEILIKTYRDER